MAAADGKRNQRNASALVKVFSVMGNLGEGYDQHITIGWHLRVNWEYGQRGLSTRLQRPDAACSEPFHSHAALLRQ